MPVWWGVFAYMMVVSLFGMAVYKRKTSEYSLVQTNASFEENSKSIGLFFAFASMILLVYFSGMRSYMFDSGEYQYAYENYFTNDISQVWEIIEGNGRGKGQLYMILLVVFKSLTNGSYTDWFTFIAILQTIPLVLFLYKYSSNYSLSLFLFFSSGAFAWMINGIRQFLAITFILYFTNWIKEKKTIRFLFVVFFACLIHSSALIWLPTYFIIHYKPWSKRFIVYSIFLMIGVFFYVHSSFVDNTDYSYLSDTLDMAGVNPLRVLVMSIPAIIAFIKRSEYEKIATPFSDILVNLSIILSEMFVIGMFTSGVFGRICMYFQVFIYVLIPWELKTLFNEDMRKTITFLCIIGFLAFFLYDMYGVGNGIYHSTVLNIDFDL